MKPRRGVSAKDSRSKQVLEALDDEEDSNDEEIDVFGRIPSSVSFVAS
jgi:hypothetical protein